MNDEIDAVVKDGITAQELAKAKTQLLRQFIERRRSDLYTAILIGSYTVYFNDPNLINTTLAKENAVTLAQVNAATRRFLARDQRTVVITLPAAEDGSSAPKAGK